jgi:hypothetical protein
VICAIRLTTNITEKRKKQILAIPAAAKAINPNPKAPAINAITKNTNE